MKPHIQIDYLNLLLWILPALLIAGLVLGSIDLFFFALKWLIIVAVVAAVGMIAYVVCWHSRNWLTPVKRVRARVVRRQKRDWEVSITKENFDSLIARLGMLGRHRRDAFKAYNRMLRKGQVKELEVTSRTDYYVTFDIDGREEEFLVPESEYIECAEDTEGILVFQGENFIQFIPRVS